MKTRPSRYCTLCGYKLLIYCRPKPSRTKRIGTVFNIGFAFVFTCVAAAMMWTGGINAWWEISLIGLAITFCPQVWWLRTHIQGNRVLETVRLSSQIAMFCLLASSAIYWILPFWLMMSPDISEILNALISKLGLHNNQLNPLVVPTNSNRVRSCHHLRGSGNRGHAARRAGRGIGQGVPATNIRVVN